MSEIKRIHHVAVLIDDMDRSLQFWRDMLGLKPSHVTDVPAEGARIAFLPLGDSEIELVLPTMSETGLSRYLEKHGPGMHHVCLQVDDLSSLLAVLKAKGVQLINDQPRVDQDGRSYAFIHPKSANGVLVELYQIQEK